MNLNHYESELNKYIGKTFEELSIIVGKSYTKESKGRKNQLSKALFQQHFQKSENLRIVAPTIIVGKDGLEKLKYAVSFPAFVMGKLIKEDWDISTPKKQIIDKKFLFFFWKLLKNETMENNYRLVKIKSWSFPKEDVNELKNVWQKTILEIQNKTFQFPKESETSVSHVRPHGKNGKDFDLSIKSEGIPKKCFWLNRDYLTEEVYKKE